MKFSSTNQVLTRGISAVRNAVGSPISNPIVENIHISCRNQSVFFMATNLNLTIRCEGEVVVEEPGEILLSSDVITNVVQDLPNTEIFFETKEENVFIRGGKFKGRMKGQTGELFPPFVCIEEGETIRLKNEKIKDIIKKTIISTSQEKSRYELNGVKLDIKESKMHWVATDGRRLAVYSIEDADLFDKDYSILIPEKTLQEVLRIFPDDGEVVVKIGQRKIQFSSGDVTILSNLLLNNFPQYERIIPVPGEIKVRMDRALIASSVRRAANLTSKETKMIIMTMENGKVEIHGEREEAGSEGSDQIEAEYEGEQISIRFNHDFISDFLKVVNVEKVEIELRDARKPGLFREVGDQEYKYILMPMRPPGEEKTEE